MTLIDKLKRTAVSAGLGLAVLVGCGDDKCGESPFYGKWLWEIAECEIAFHFRTDCSVDRYDDTTVNRKTCSTYLGTSISDDSQNQPICNWAFEQSSSLPTDCAYIGERVTRAMQNYASGYIPTLPRVSDGGPICEYYFLILDDQYPGQEECEHRILE